MWNCYTDTLVHMHMYRHTHRHTCTHAHVQAHTYSSTHAACTSTHKHTHTHTHTHTHDFNYQLTFSQRWGRWHSLDCRCLSLESSGQSHCSGPVSLPWLAGDQWIATMKPSKTILYYRRHTHATINWNKVTLGDRKIEECMGALSGNVPMKSHPPPSPTPV